MALRTHGYVGGVKSLVTRVRDLDARRIDLLVGLVFAIEFQVEASFMDAPAHEVWTTRVLLLAFAAGLAVRTRLPVVAVFFAFVTFAATSPMGADVNDAIFAPFFGLFLTTFSLAALTDGRELALGVVIALTGLVCALALDQGSLGPGSLAFITLILVVAPVLAGRVMRSRTQLARILRAKADAAEREREQAVREAVADERVRIAGELHDVVSHALSAMVVQASAARRLARRDPDRGREAFAGVEKAGREALAEMRRLLGVLRREDEDLALAPQPSLEHLSTLLRRALAAGLPTDLEIAGARRPLPLGADLIAYRVVQEALDAALRFGSAGHAKVRLAYGDDHVDVEVRDDGGGGRDLLAVEQRVAVYGGRLVAGAGRAGHTVRARLPIGAAG